MASFTLKPYLEIVRTGGDSVFQLPGQRNRQVYRAAAESHGTYLYKLTAGSTASMRKGATVYETAS